MFIIFPAAEAIATLQADIAEYRRKYGNPVIESAYAGGEPSEAECFEIIYGMADDAMNTHLMWVPPSTDYPQMNAALRKLFQHWEGDGYEIPSEHFFREVLDPAIIQIHFWIDLLMVKPSWHVWNIKPLGDFDIVLEKGEDYRVLDWNRRMESGEWTDPAYDASKDRKVPDDEMQAEIQYAKQAQAALRMQAEAILRKFNMPPLRHLDEAMLDFLRSKMGGDPSHTRRVVFRDQPMPKLKSELPCGSVVIYDPAATDDSAVVEQPKTIVEAILEDSPNQQQPSKRRRS